MYTHIKLKVKFPNKVLVIMLHSVWVCVSQSASLLRIKTTHTLIDHILLSTFLTINLLQFSGTHQLSTLN